MQTLTLVQACTHGVHMCMCTYYVKSGSNNFTEEYSVNLWSWVVWNLWISVNEHPELTFTYVCTWTSAKIQLHYFESTLLLTIFVLTLSLFTQYVCAAICYIASPLSLYLPYPSLLSHNMFCLLPSGLLLCPTPQPHWSTPSSGSCPVVCCNMHVLSAGHFGGAPCSGHPDCHSPWHSPWHSPRIANCVYAQYSCYSLTIPWGRTVVRLCIFLLTNLCHAILYYCQWVLCKLVCNLYKFANYTAWGKWRLEKKNQKPDLWRLETMNRGQIGACVAETPH